MATVNEIQILGSREIWCREIVVPEVIDVAIVKKGNLLY